MSTSTDKPPTYNSHQPSGYQPAPANYGTGVGYNPPPVQHNAAPVTNNIYRQPLPRTNPTGDVSDNYMTLSIILTVLCCVCSGLSSLICTIPALIFANAARDAEARGDEASRRTNAHLALGFNIGAVIWWVVLIIIIIVVSVVNTNNDNGYYSK